MLQRLTEQRSAFTRDVVWQTSKC